MKPNSFSIFKRALPFLSAIGLFFTQTEIAWSHPRSVYFETPYEDTEDVYLHLKFPHLLEVQAGPVGTPATINNNPVYASTPSVGGFSWELMAQGRTNILNVIENHARTRISEFTRGGQTFNALSFSNANTGVVSSLLGISLTPSVWSATTVINNATTWDPGYYALEFDFAYLGGVLSLNPSLLNNFRVRILEGATVRVDTDNITGGLVKALLDLDLGAVLVGDFIHDARLNFLYGGTAPLTLEFSASQSILSLEVLDLVKNVDLFTIANIDIVAVPEPTKACMMLLTIMTSLSFYRRR